MAERMSDPAYFRQDPATMRDDQRRAEQIEALIHGKLERWEALEAKQKAAP